MFKCAVLSEDSSLNCVGLLLLIFFRKFLGTLS
jgi:hypothetical protein